MFPTPEDENNPGMTKGGIILVKLQKLEESSEPIKFRLEYVDTENNKYSEEYSFTIPQGKEEAQFDNTSIQKGIALSRFVSFMKHYLRSPSTPEISLTSGITIPTPLTNESTNPKPRQSIDLSQEWKPLFAKFVEYFASQVDMIGDKKMEKELSTLQKLQEEKKQ